MIVTVLELVFYFLIVAVFVLSMLVLRRRPKPRAPVVTETPAAPTEAPALFGTAGAADYEELVVELTNNPPWYERVGAYAFPLLHIAFVASLLFVLHAR